MRASSGSAVVVAVLCAGAAYAQHGVGVVFGVVEDGESGGPLPGVTVVATSAALQGAITARTDEQGRYRVDGLPPGAYALSYERDGFQRDAVAGIQVRADSTLRVDTLLFPGGDALPPSPAEVADRVSVAARAPTVDVGSAATGMNVDDDFARRVPLVPPTARGATQRSFEALAETAPGAQLDRYGVSIHGATSPENVYLIDGLAVGNAAYGTLGTALSLEYVEETNVVTGGYLPEYGRATGGAVSVVTKTGGDRMRGAVYASLVPGALSGRALVPPNQGSVIRTETQLDYLGDVGAVIAGPIVADRLWFFTGVGVARRQYTLTRRLYGPTGEIGGGARAWEAQEMTLQSFSKLTYRLNDANRFSLTFFATPTNSGDPDEFGIDPQTGEPEVLNVEGAQPALAHQYDSGAIGATLRWTLDVVPRVVALDTAVGVHHENGAVLAADGSRPGASTGFASTPHVIYRRSEPGFHSIADFEDVPAAAGCDPAGTEAATRCAVPSYALGGPFSLHERQLDRAQARSTLSWVFDLFGLHVVKAGVDGDFATYENRRGYGGGTVYRESSDGASFSDLYLLGHLAGPDDEVRLDQLTWRSSSATTGVFVQDAWTAFDVVTLAAGVRYDAQFLFAGDGTLMMALPHQISPRVGVVYDFTQEGRSKLYASYAKYFQGVPLDVADRVGASSSTIESRHDAALCDPRDPAQHRGVCSDDESRVVVGDPESPDRYWTTIGAGKTPVDPAIRAPSTDELLLGGEYELFRDARVGASYVHRWLSDAIEDMSRDEGYTYFVGNPGAGAASGFPRAERTYDAATAYFEKRFSDEWLAHASYTWSWLRGNYAGLYRPETGQLDPNVSSDFDLVSLLENRAGDLPFDRRHSFKAFAARDFVAAYDNTFTVGAAFRAESGRPTNLLGSHAVYGDQEVFILPRGSGDELPWRFDVDVHGGWRVPVGDDVALSLTVDVFNLFDFQAPIAVDQEYTRADVLPIVGGRRGDERTKLVYADGRPAGDEARNPNFGLPTQYQPPRTFRFGVRAEF